MEMGGCLISKAIDEAFNTVISKLKSPKTPDEYYKAFEYMGIERSRMICNMCVRKYSCVAKGENIIKCNFYKRSPSIAE